MDVIEGRRVSLPTLTINPGATGDPERPTDHAYAWHRALPEYAPTPLRELPDLAASLGLRQLRVKDETHRLGMPAFKILGVSWAVRTVLSELAARPGRPVLVAATDGNHGHAVARVAAQRGCRSLIFVPGDTTAARIAMISGAGAKVVVVNGDYDAAVAAAAALAASEHDAVLISDTAFEPDEIVPRAVIDGYGTLFREIGDQLGDAVPDLVVMQIGCGGLAAAAGRFFRHAGFPVTPYLCGIEPTSAACAVASIGQREPARIVSDFGSVMVGLNAGRLSASAWADVSASYDAFVTVDDDWCFEARSRLRNSGVPAGETGSSGLAGLLALRHLTAAATLPTDNPALSRIRAASSALVVVTEGEIGA